MTSAQSRLLGLIEAETGRCDGWPIPFSRFHELSGYRSRSTTHRLVDALVGLGLVEHSPYSTLGGYRLVGSR